MLFAVFHSIRIWVRAYSTNKACLYSRLERASGFTSPCERAWLDLALCELAYSFLARWNLALLILDPWKRSLPRPPLPLNDLPIVRVTVFNDRVFF